MTALYSVVELLTATGGRAENVDATGISSISIDSREIASGALFAAIKGDRFDGHDFVAAAVDAGAAIALVSEAHAHELEGEPLIVVPDALEGLAAIGRFARRRADARVVGVTGSVGKTTTKDALRAIFSAAGPTHAALRSFNNQWGVPLTLARMPAGTQFGVFEIGMNAAGEITPLTRMVRPDVVLITSVAPAHMQNFDSLDDIARAKAEIFLGLEPGGCAVLNADHPCLDVLLAAARKAEIERIVTYGLAETADVRILEAGPDGAGMRARVKFPDGEVPLDLVSAGVHRVVNAVGALCVAREVGLDVIGAAETLSSVSEPEGRGAVERFGPADKPLVMVDESYNANPASMNAALEVFAAMSPAGGRKVLVLGDMGELGTQSRRMHAELKQAVLTSRADTIFLTGPDMSALRDTLHKFSEMVYVESVPALCEMVLNYLDYGDTIMVKGANSLKLTRLVSRIRGRFEKSVGPDREP